MPLLNSNYLDRPEMLNSEIEPANPTTPNSSQHDILPSLGNYSIRDDDEEDTSSDQESREPHQAETSSLKSWFFRPKSKTAAASDTSTKENTEAEHIGSSGSGIGQDARANSKNGPPFKKSLRSFFKREENKELDVPENITAEPGNEGRRHKQHRFWKSWRGHHSYQNNDCNYNERNNSEHEIADVNDDASKEDPNDILTHEQKRERIMEKLTEQLMNFSSSDEEEVIGNGTLYRSAERPKKADFIDDNDAYNHKDNDSDNGSNYESSDSSTTSSLERAKEIKSKVGGGFSPASEDKNNEISPLTPVDDVMDNPYKYVFDSNKTDSNASIAYDCSWIDKNSVTFDNFEKALKILTKDLTRPSFLMGSLFTISELSNEFLNVVKNYAENHDEVNREKNDMGLTLNAIENSFGDLKSELEQKDQQNAKLTSELEHLKKRYLHLEKDFESLADEAEILTDEVAHSKRDILAAKDLERIAREGAQEEINSLKKLLDDKTNDLTQALDDLQNERTNQSSLRKKMDDLQSNTKIINDKLQYLEKENDTKKIKCEFFESQYQTLKGECDSVRAQHESMKANYHCIKEKHECIQNECDSLKGQLASLQNDYKTTIHENEIINEKNSLLTTRLSELAGSRSQPENYERDMRGNNQESFATKLHRYGKIIELLKVGNLKIQDNFHTERNKVLDLRKNNNILKKQIQLIECYRTQSLQFMSHLMFYYRGIVADEVLANFEFHLKRISSFGSIMTFADDDDSTEKKMEERVAEIVKFYNEVAKDSFLDQIVTKHVSYMRSNNFLSNQLSDFKKKNSECQAYAKHLLQEVETYRKNSDKNQKNQKNVVHMKKER